MNENVDILTDELWRSSEENPGQKTRWLFVVTMVTTQSRLSLPGNRVNERQTETDRKVSLEQEVAA